MQDVVAQAGSARARGATTAEYVSSAASHVDVDVVLALNHVDTEYVCAEADETFSKVDANGDGKIELHEFQRYLAGSGYTPADIDRWFASLDAAPTDGVISPEEMRMGYLRYESATLRLALGLRASMDAQQPQHDPHDSRLQLADELFDVIDANGDGAISNRELRGHLQGTGYSLTTIDAIFKALDINNDNEVSREELRVGFARYEYSALRVTLGILP